MKVIKPNVENDKFTNIVFIPYNGIVESFIMEYKKSNDGKIESISQFSTEFVKKGEAFINPQIYESINTQKGWWELVLNPCTCAKHHSIFASEECPCETEGGGSGPSLFLVWHGDGGNVVVFPLPVSATPNNSTPQPAPEPTNPVPTNPTPTNQDGSGGAANENTNYEEQLFPISIRDFDLENECVSNFVSSISSDQEEWLNIGDNVLFNNIIYDLPNEQADCEANKTKAQAILNLLMANSNATLKYQLKDYYNQTGDMQTVIDFLNQCFLNPTLHLDFNASIKSPMNIDRTAIDNNTPEGQKFNQIYDKLCEVDKFKKLIIDLFHVNDRDNIKFFIQDGLTDGQGHPVKGWTEEVNGIMEIRLNRQMFLNTGQNKQSKIEIAKTILHECIHAYLKNKALHPSNGQPIPNAQNMTETQLIAAIEADQHTFIFVHMIPLMEDIMSQLLNELTTPQQRSDCEQFGSPQPWIWADYIHYLCLSGLEDSPEFINLLQPTYNSNNVMNGGNAQGQLYLAYIATGNLMLYP